MDGILNINKATGMTSHDVVAKVRKILKQKRVGHAGTLDPAASGVLPICLGQGTRVAEYLSDSGKAYRGEIVFGTVTDTYDTEGTILRTTNVEQLTLAQIEEVLPGFLGLQMQMPPRYSAIKLQAYLNPVASPFKNYPAIHLDTPTAEGVLHGNAFRYRLNLTIATPVLARVYSSNGHFVAIAEWKEEDEMWQPKKVFSTDCV